MAADFAGVQRVAPEFGQRRAREIQRLVLAQARGRLGLAARHQHHVLRLFVQAKGNGGISGSVAGMQGGDDIHLLRQRGRLRRFFGAERQKSHAREPQLLRQRGGSVHQFLPGFDAVNRAGSTLAEKQIVEDETQIRLARTVVGQRDALGAFGFKFLQQRLDETEKVQHLLELAARVLVQPPIAREDVQLLEQLDGLTGPQQFLQGRILVA